MSRGLGALQRRILTTLEPDRLLNVMVLACVIHGRPIITTAQYETLRRAVRSLEKRGLIGDTWWYMFFSSAGPKRYGLPPAIDRMEERAMEFLDRSQARSGVSVGAAPNPILSRPDKSCDDAQPNTYRVELEAPDAAA